jgi:hypothetical protein
VISIGDYAFSLCQNLKTVVLSKSVTNLGEGQFTYCSKLEEITVDEENPAYCSVDGILFNKDQTKLIRYTSGRTDGAYTIPDGVKSVGAYAFSFCLNLTDITIPDGVTSIGNSAFSQCHNLVNVTVPDSVTNIGQAAFDYCINLQSVNLPECLRLSGWAFQKCSKLSEITLPKC